MSCCLRFGAAPGAVCVPVLIAMPEVKFCRDAILDRFPEEQLQTERHLFHSEDAILFRSPSKDIFCRIFAEGNGDNTVHNVRVKEAEDEMRFPGPALRPDKSPGKLADMGSLVPGWDSPTAARTSRNRSFTKEEIETYWNLHKSLQHQPDKSLQHQPVIVEGELKKQMSPRGSPCLKHYGTTECPVDFDKVDKLDAWWMRSNSAFLNEPPHEDMRNTASNYTPQFHVTQITATKYAQVN
ncbi:hypothetical protein GIB67_004373 [Kingdonia uniflora]|uniref:Uncharacterized protein n=1 Tax=Kingdonia uniflora TaxID=39325 RepID=A0A7J7MR99_9MAGN|nr:hypothetical protein GIB67_004373 [Kingdonia uniflora]